MDLEVCRHAKAYLRNFEVNDYTMAYDVIAERGPRGNYLDHEHTFANFKENIFTDKAENCFLFANGYENYRQTAKEKLDNILATNKAPEFDAALVAELDKISASAEKCLTSR